jgi:hypothetical protein
LEVKINDVENALRGFAECMATGIWPGVGLGRELPLFPEQNHQSENDRSLELQTELSGGPLRDNPNEHDKGSTSEN